MDVRGGRPRYAVERKAMDHLLTALAVGSLAYLATNMDALVVLIAFLSNPRFTPAQIVMGQYLGISALIAASLAGALLSLIIPRADLGLFGFSRSALV